MPKTIQADGEAMPAANLSRRTFLRSATAASLTLATAAPALAAVAVSNAELMRVVAEIEHTEIAIGAAEIAKEAARARYAAIAPEPPAHLVVPLKGHSYRHPFYNVAESERDCFDEFISWPLGDERKVVCSWSFERTYRELLEIKSGRPSGDTRWARGILADVKKYEAEVQAARKAAGCDDAHFDLDDQFSRMDTLGRELAAAQALSGADIAAKARAFDRHRACLKRRERGYYNDTMAADALKADIFALFGGVS